VFYLKAAVLVGAAFVLGFVMVAMLLRCLNGKGGR